MQVQPVQLVAVSRLRPNKANPKKGMGAKARKGLREALARFGFAGLMVCAADPDGTLEVLDGNTRLEELTRAGISEVPAIVYEGMSEEDRRTFTLTHDRHRKQFDEEEVKRQLAALGAHPRQDVAALSRLSGKSVDKVLREQKATAGPAAEQALREGAHAAFLVLTGPTEDVREVQQLLRVIRERVSQATKAKDVLGRYFDALVWEDERLLTVLLSVVRRFEVLYGEGTQANADRPEDPPGEPGAAAVA